MAGNLTAMIAAAFSGSAAPPVTSDPYFEYTTLLLPGNGTNGAQNNTFLDGSTNNFTITRNGNTTQGTFSPFSQTGWGGFASATGQYLTAATNTQFNLSSSDFTVEAWIYPTAFNTYNYIYSRDGATNATSEIDFYFGATGNIAANFYSGSTNYNANSSGGALTLNRWQHVALVRNGGTLTIYVEGTSVATNSSLSTLAANTTTIAANILNSAGAANRGMQGYCSNFRLAIGVAVYTGAFTPPTSPLAATQSSGTNISAITGTQTKILTFQSNRFIDNSVANSGAGWTLTVTGSLSVQAFSPFNPTSSWSAATYGGSGYFDGSGDYLSIASNAALQFDGQFTIECWYYPKTLATYDALIVTSNDASSTNGIGIFLKASGGIQLYNYVTNTTIFDTSSGVIANAWNHIAVTRNSSNGIDLWVNGASQGTTQTVSSNFNSTTPTRIGLSTTSAQDCDGYISSVRMIKGASVYSGAFTPPSLAPLTIAGSTSAAAYPSTTNVNTSFASSATSLLLNFTNAGIYDATSKNDLETVGNAQISTAQSKWGGSSMYFDGTGDYLNISPDRFSSFGTGSFTIEFWMKTSGSSFNIINPATATGTGYWALLVQTSIGGFRWNDAYDVTNLWTQTATSVLDNNWHHIAVVRNGTGSGNVNIYFDGVAQGTAKTDSTNYNGASTAWRIGSGNVGAFNGYIQDLRITPGIARYTANFTAPTAAFPTL